MGHGGNGGTLAGGSVGGLLGGLGLVKLWIKFTNTELVLTPFSSQGRFPRLPAALRPPEPKAETPAPPNCLLPMIEGPAVGIQWLAILVGQQHRLPERHNCPYKRGGGGLHRGSITVCPERQGSGNPWTASGHRSLLISRLLQITE
jgi:hypothetical protein